METAREAQLKRQIMERLAREPGVLVRKRWGGPYTVAGDPDLTGCYHGRHFEIELKRPGEEPTLIQTLRLRQWAEVGAIVGVAHTVEEAFQILGIEVPQK